MANFRAAAEVAAAAGAAAGEAATTAAAGSGSGSGAADPRSHAVWELPHDVREAAAEAGGGAGAHAAPRAPGATAGAMAEAEACVRGAAVRLVALPPSDQRPRGGSIGDDAVPAGCSASSEAGRLLQASSPSMMMLGVLSSRLDTSIFS
jgi:hypothetical protein